jgi:hypothetical protein
MSDEQKDALAEARQKALEAKQAELDAANEKRTGKGTRLQAGYTRGRNTQLVVWEAFNRNKPETLPLTLSEFMDITKVQDEALIVGYLMDGYNDSMREIASDPIAEFVESTWSDEHAKQFRLVVRNYAAALNLSVEDAVGQIKPNFVAGLAKLNK